MWLQGKVTMARNFGEERESVRGVAARTRGIGPGFHDVQKEAHRVIVCFLLRKGGSHVQEYQGYLPSLRQRSHSTAL